MLGRAEAPGKRLRMGPKTCWAEYAISETSSSILLRKMAKAPKAGMAMINPATVVTSAE